MKRLTFTVVKNAGANIVRGGATAVVALALPHFLVKALDTDRFSAWSLILQIAAYASYLDFGLQTAVARFLAQAIELRDLKKRDHLVSTALVMLTGAGSLAIVAITLVLWQLPHVFHGIPPSLLPEFRLAAFILAVASCIGLPFSTFTGVLVGLHKNEYPAIAIGGSRIAGASLVIVACHYTHSLVMLAACVALPNLAGGLVQFKVAKHLLTGIKISFWNMQRKLATEVSRYCAGLTAFSFAMMLISGMDVTIVAHFKFEAAGAYSIAATLVVVFAGINIAVTSAWLAPFSALLARGEFERVRHIVLNGGYLNLLANLILLVVAIVAGRPLLLNWVGASYATAVFPILILLLVGQSIRLVGNCYGVALIAAGEQHRGILPSLAEGVVNFGSSILLMSWMGPIGVAWGTVIGSICGLLMAVFYVIPFVHQIRFHSWEFLRESLFKPGLSSLPMVCGALAFQYMAFGPESAVVLLVSVTLTGALVIRNGNLARVSRL